MPNRTFTTTILFAFVFVFLPDWSQATNLRGRDLLLADDLPQIQNSVAGRPSAVFIPLQLGPESIPFAVSENDIFRGYKLDIADGESPLKDHVFSGLTEAVPFVHTSSFSRLVQTSREVMDTMGIEGSLSVSYGPLISGEGAGRFLQKNIASKNQVSFLYRVTHTAFARKALIQSIQQNGSLSGKGTRFIDSIIYGAQLDVRYTITAKEDVNIQEIEAELNGKIGIGPLSVGFQAKFEKKTGSESSDYEMEIEAKASGVNFFIPPSLTYESFEQVNGYINAFNGKYESLFDGLAGQETVDTEENILQQLTPIGMTLGESADYTSELDLLDSLALAQRLEDLRTVFFDALEWKETLRRAMTSAKNRYHGDPFERDTVYKPYEAVALDYANRLDEQVDACLAFRASARTAASIPNLYPVGLDERVLEGLTGEVYIPQPFELLGTTYQDLHYIGYAVPDDKGGVKPWMSGVARNDRFEVIAKADTPEGLRDVLNNEPPESPVPVMPWAPQTEYSALIKVGDANLFMHAWGGIAEGNHLRLHGDESYAFRAANSQFRIVDIGQGRVIICTQFEDLCLHSYGGSKDGTHIQLHHGRNYATSTSNSWYKIIDNSNGKKMICTADGTDLCLHAWGGSKDGMHIRLHGGLSYARKVPNSQFLVQSYGLGPYGPNVALGKPAKQSSNRSSADGASNAVDGNTNGRFFDGSVTHTQKTTDPFWEVDLLENFWVHHIKIHNRVDCCTERLSGSVITLYDESRTKTLVKAGPVSTSGVEVFEIDYSIGSESFFPVRYVSVSLAGSDRRLSLAEVEVHGSPFPQQTK